MKLKKKTRKVWCTLRGHFYDRVGSWERRRRKSKGTMPPTKARCPDCGKQFTLSVTNDMDGDYIYRIPPHKKRVK